MTTLAIYADTDASAPLVRHVEFAAIAQALSGIGVGIERWEAHAPLSSTAGPEEVMAAYRESIAALNRLHGFRSMDVVVMYPDHPERVAARSKFLAEHTHADFEIRFFVDGSGLFYIHCNGKVYMTLCTAGDLIKLPAGITHWFDMGERPMFKAIRFFTAPDGWVGNFTGDAIAERFPKYESPGRHTA